MSPGQIWNATFATSAPARSSPPGYHAGPTLPTIMSLRSRRASRIGAPRGAERSADRARHPDEHGVVGSLLLAAVHRCLPGLPTQGNVLVPPRGGLRFLLRLGVVAHHRAHRLLVEPDLGMTIATLMGTCLLFVALGWTDASTRRSRSPSARGLHRAANAGNTSQDLKTGYIVGATPRISKRPGDRRHHVVVRRSACTTAVACIRRSASGRQQVAAPQATLMATHHPGTARVRSCPWGLVLVGVFIAITLELCGIHSLSFAVGSYLPIATTAPIFAGGLVRWWVERKTGVTSDSEISAGTLFSSGLIAGGSLAGILFAILVGTGTIGPFAAIPGNALPFLHGEDAMGHILGGLLFFALAMILARFGQRKLTYSR